MDGNKKKSCHARPYRTCTMKQSRSRPPEKLRRKKRAADKNLRYYLESDIAEARRRERKNALEVYKPMAKTFRATCKAFY